jgi:predicted PurR-regulated permease PerM
VALIQAIVVGICLLVVGVPWPGLLAVAVLARLSQISVDNL